VARQLEAREADLFGGQTTPLPLLSKEGNVTLNKEGNLTSARGGPASDNGENSKEKQLPFSCEEGVSSREEALKVAGGMDASAVPASAVAMYETPL
jgi:hypothetical protein